MLKINFDNVWLKHLINLRGISQTELAARVGVSIQTISNYVVGRRVPDMVTLAEIFRALDMTAGEARNAFGELFVVEEVGDDSV